MEQSHNQRQDNSLLYVVFFLLIPAVVVLVVAFVYLLISDRNPTAQKSVPQPTAQENEKKEFQEYNITERNCYLDFKNCFGTPILKRVKIEPYVLEN